VEARERAALQEAVAASELSAATHAVEASIQEAAEARAALFASNATGAPGPGGVAVRSATTGTVLRVLQESDRVLDAGTPLFEIGDLGEIEVVTEMLSSDAMQVKPGSLMWIGGFGDRNQEVEGRVRRVEPSGFTKLSALGVEEQRVNVVGDFVEPPERIGDGYRVEVRVVVWATPSTVLIPGSALYRDGAGWRALVIEGGRAASREVQVGHRTSSLAEVTKGLATGERVILYPGDRVTDGMRVVSEERREGPEA
jgi:HlyD family secretion protein